MLALILAGIIATPTKSRPERMWGVTIDNVTQVSVLVESLKTFRRRPTARIVFDPGSAPDDYVAPVHAIREVADIMGSPIDSAPPSGKLTVAQYRDRVSRYMDKLGSAVNLWEIGNEVNGDWTCESAEMANKIAASLEEAKSRHKTTALTLFYSDFYRGTDREMVAWSLKYLPESVRRGLDYVFVSFYPDNVKGIHPAWARIFRDLGAAFPAAKLGFGELGLRKADFSLSDNVKEKQALIERYYRMPSPLPDRYVGGFFWWTYRQDTVSRHSPIWTTLHSVIR